MFYLSIIQTPERIMQQKNYMYPLIAFLMDIIVDVLNYAERLIFGELGLV